MTHEQRLELRQLISDARRALLTRGSTGNEVENAKRAARRRRGTVATHNANGYRNGCRCEICTVAHTISFRERAAKKRAA